ncbi:MAG TPA: antitoxin MazE family protein [Ottowia sp.]|nr:antitoxin MazE family protein [Ottowia sp.]HNK53038.1 antitoxin MazE family protein [Ottowia sp.]HNL42761.1 antitoxin MazE family protein [Ottowia sp.]HNN33888.1 antitoxin MazE family protein [Ottowia sp.]
MLHATTPPPSSMTAIHVNERVQKHRDALRAAGLRPVQLWVPDTRRPGFAAECLRQARLAAKADRADAQLQRLMDEALTDLDGWAP